MESFEEAAFALVQSMSPSKNLAIEDVPYDSLKAVISNCLGRKGTKLDEGYNGNGTVNKKFKYDDESSEQNKSNGIFRRPSFSLGGEDEDSRMSDSRLSAGPSDESITTNDEESRSSNLSFSKRKIHHGSGHSLSNGMKLNLSGFSLRQIKRAKRIQEMRELRRKQAMHEEFTEFGMTNDELSWDTFLSWWETTMTQDAQILFLFHQTINSLRNHFSRHTWSTNVEEQVIKFLKETVPMLRRHIAASRERSSEIGPTQQVKEAELLIMLEMHILTNKIGSASKEQEIKQNNNDSEVDWTRFVNKMVSDLRFIFTAVNTTYMRGFLEETLCDTFSHIIPRTLAEIFDELCIAMPPDLEEFATNSNSAPPSGGNSPSKGDLHRTDSVHSGSITEFCQTKASNSRNALDQLFDELNEPSARSDSSQLVNNSSKSKPGISDADVDYKRKAKDNTLSKFAKRKIVPETPEKKLQKLHRKVEDNEEILATPIAKMQRGKDKRKEQRLSEVIRKSEERLVRQPRAAAVASEKASRAIIQAVSLSEVPKTSKETFLSLNRSSTRPSKARTNLTSLFENSK
ncbi:unnamed protein product, partial [Mesorhabditis belari]|uniref:Treslin STD domain-containing protein n=1 Tax=Mesorhabditis belari TaxID=2138241 RepID=A0AAF3F5F9_9BILA